jgi:hypothetical protein
MQLFFTISLEAERSILLISIYISIIFNIHFEGHQFFQTIFERHFSPLFYHYFHFISYNYRMMRG